MNKKPERVDHRYEGELISCQERDMYNQGLEDMEVFNKQALGSVGEVETILATKMTEFWNISDSTKEVVADISQAIHNYYKERFGV